MTGMAVIPHIVCDYCDKPGRPWRIQSPPQPAWEVDLCDDHASDIRALKGKARKSRRQGRVRLPVAPDPEYDK